jgi:hypothetical protein
MKDEGGRMKDKKTVQSTSFSLLFLENNNLKDEL